MSPRLRRQGSLVLAAVLAAGIGACRDRRTLDELEEAFEELGETPTGGDSSAEGLDRVQRLLLRGMEPVGPSFSGEISRGGTLDHVVELDPGVCYGFAAYTDAPGFDLDLRVDGPDGLPVAIDDAPDGFPVVDGVCPERSGQYAVRLVAARGNGAAIGRVYRESDESWSQARARLAELAASRLGDPVRPLGPPQRARLAPGERLEVPQAVLPNQCYGLVGTSSGGPRDVDLALVVDGEVVARDIGIEPAFGISRWCASRAGTIRWRIHAIEGQGRVVWRAFEVAPEG